MGFGLQPSRMVVPSFGMEVHWTWKFVSGKIGTTISRSERNKNGSNLLAVTTLLASKANLMLGFWDCIGVYDPGYLLEYCVLLQNFSKDKQLENEDSTARNKKRFSV